MHASSVLQSSSDSQPGGFGTTTALHSPSLFDIHPSGQVQVNVLRGVLSSTLHLADDVQGFNSTHGFTQCSLMQASCVGQLESMRHSGSAGVGGADRSQ